MKISVIIKSAVASLKNNGRRTFLTMIGIIIGIASVITILSLGNGFREKTVNSLTQDSQGRQHFSVQFESESEGEGINERLIPFKESDWKLISAIPEVDEVKEPSYSVVQEEYYEVQARDKSEMYLVNFQIEPQERPLLTGRNISASEANSPQLVTVINDVVANHLFGSVENALKKTVKINNKNFVVIGVMQSEEPNFDINMFGETQSEEPLLSPPDAVIPRGVYETFFKEKMTLSEVEVYIKPGKTLSSVSKNVVQVLNQSGSAIKDGKYTHIDMGEAMDSIGSVLQTVTYFITAVAAISLFIAGVGVMNMMYISVSERTKEIGIRRAMGATKQSIQLQFLLEGTLITLMGGMIGFLLGIVIAWIVSSFLPFGIKLDIYLIIITIMVSSTVGIIFSVFPAKSAANKNLVEIMR